MYGNERRQTLKKRWVNVCLFQMLAEAGKLDQVESQMGNKEFYIETKYDGERMQAHINGNNFK